jgi:hypothetical protein
LGTVSKKEKFGFDFDDDLDDGPSADPATTSYNLPHKKLPTHHVF